ncbi:MAG: holo-ACP synthase [Lentisphaeria bacterium]
MIIGIGIDIVEIARLKASIERSGKTFLDHVYTLREQQNAPQNARVRVAYYAGRWAAKEALAKALKTGITKDCALREINISNHEGGYPVVELTGHAAETAEKLGVKHWHISISHEQNYACAEVLAEG